MTLPAGDAERRMPDPTALAFEVYAVECCFRVQADVDDGTAPEWCRLFDMARAVRAHPQAGRHKPLRVAAMIWDTAVELHDEFGSYEDFAAGFAAAWKKVRLLPGEQPLAAAARLAERTPLGLRPEHRDEVTPGFVRFVSLAGWLCVVLARDRIKLPCREVGETLRVRKDTVSVYRQQAEELEYLRTVKAHTHRPGGVGEATTFVFPVALWDVLMRAMPKGFRAER